ncbi:MAG: chalcone isomerase family protein [Geothermobacteraceae bacterium]
MTRFAVLHLIFLMLLGSGLVPSALATSVNAEFPARLEESSNLELRGTSTLRWMGLFKVYAGGFYLPAEVASARWDEDVAKCLELVYFRRIAAEDFGKASDKMLKKSLGAEAYTRIEERLAEFYRFFRDVKAGDRYTLIYRPGGGTELRLNGESLGVVPGNDFARAYFGIWLGEAPLDKGFRDQLLRAGRGPERKD